MASKPTATEVASVVAIVAVDPGRITGVARGLFRPADAGSTEEAFNAGSMVEAYECEGRIQAQAEEITAETADWFADLNMAGIPVPAMKLVVEDFQLRTQHADLTPVELTSRLTAEWLRLPFANIEIERQTPANAKSYATKARLRRWGAWQIGSEHRRDAVRHLLLRLSKEIQ